MIHEKCLDNAKDIDLNSVLNYFIYYFLFLLITFILAFQFSMQDILSCCQISPYAANSSHNTMLLSHGCTESVVAKESLSLVWEKNISHVGFNLKMETGSF